MPWLRRHRVRRYLADSNWILPVLSMVAALGAVRLLDRVDAALGWRPTIQPEAARSVLSALASSMFTLIVFVSSALLVAVQLASGQLTPRIIAVVFKDPITKSSLTAFVFIFTFSLAALLRISDFVPRVTSAVAAYGCLVSLGVFLFLIDHIGKALRPSVASRRVALLGRAVIEIVYPRGLSEARDRDRDSADVPRGEPSSTITSSADGVVLAFDVQGLVALAERADCVIELAPQVGDFVAAGDPLFRVFRGGATLPAADPLPGVRAYSCAFTPSRAVSLRYVKRPARSVTPSGMNGPGICTTCVAAGQGTVYRPLLQRYGVTGGVRRA